MDTHRLAPTELSASFSLKLCLLLSALIFLPKACCAVRRGAGAHKTQQRCAAFRGYCLTMPCGLAAAEGPECGGRAVIKHAPDGQMRLVLIRLGVLTCLVEKNTATPAGLGQQWKHWLASSLLLARVLVLHSNTHDAAARRLPNPKRCRRCGWRGQAREGCMECKLGHLEEGDIKTQGGMRQNVFPGFMEFRAYDQSVKLSVARPKQPTILMGL